MNMFRARHFENTKKVSKLVHENLQLWKFAKSCTRAENISRTTSRKQKKVSRLGHKMSQPENHNSATGDKLPEGLDANKSFFCTRAEICLVCDVFFGNKKSAKPCTKIGKPHSET